MNEQAVLLPDGTPFAFWDDQTVYKKVYHVAAEAPNASDEGPGTEAQPFRTINRAAAVLQPGEKVVIHRGIYRECVRPARGGAGPDAMIAYEAAPGEQVTIRGSEEWSPTFVESKEFNWGGYGQKMPNVTVWAADLPAEWFVGYNPFTSMNFPSDYCTFVDDWTIPETHVFMLRRGLIFYQGKPLQQLFSSRELGSNDGAWWTTDPGLRIHLRLPGDENPNGKTFEVTTREQCFAPTVGGLGYIRVSGLTMEYGANVFPVPQRGILSATRGHHWIVEDCTVRWANSQGIDLGNETWYRYSPGDDRSEGGHHIVRHCAVTDCGVCGIAAVGNNAGTLIEDNLIERIGWQNIERVWEAGGLKFHTCDSALFRRNVFRHINHAPGLWLDVLNKNCRMTENVFADIASIKGALYLEMCSDLDLIDHNIFWDIRGDFDRPWTDIFERPGFAINLDSGEQAVVAHNLFAQVPDSYTVWINLDQKERLIAGKVGLCREYKVLNNLFSATPKRILFGRAPENVADGNMYDAADDFASFCVEYPAPKAVVTLAAWQKYLGFDRGSTQGNVSVSFDPDTLVLDVAVEGDLPQCVRVDELFDAQTSAPGPFALKDGRYQVKVPWGAGPRK